jgi:benzoylsuccinyl-CoA thiolase BbsB subunit
MTPFGRLHDRSATSLGVEAIDNALNDAGLGWKDVQTLYCGVLFLGLTPGTRVAAELGLSGIPVVNIDNASASGSSAFREAYLAVSSGRVDVALALGVGKADGMRGALGGSLRPGSPEHRDAQIARMMLPMPPVGLFAMRTRRRMHEYGSQIEQYAQIAVKNRKHASLNPYAQLRKPQTLEDVMNARMIADPLTVPHCCPIGDGAAATIVVSERKARALGLDPLVTVEASAFRTPTVAGSSTAQDSETTALTARDAYEQAGMGPEDISLVQVHDAFTVEEVDYCESMGFCAEGEGEALADAGELTIADLGDHRAAARTIRTATGGRGSRRARSHGRRRRRLPRTHPQAQLEGERRCSRSGTTSRFIRSCRPWITSSRAILAGTIATGSTWGTSRARWCSGSEWACIRTGT